MTPLLNNQTPSRKGLPPSSQLIGAPVIAPGETIWANMAAPAAQLNAPSKGAPTYFVILR